MARHVAIITAHPDDEVLFFTPTIKLLLRRPGITLHVICLSSGNYYGQGSARRLELSRCCARLGVRRECVHLVEHLGLQDGPDQAWRPEVVGACVGRLVTSLGLELCVTFDDGGVSGHANHCALAPGMRWLLRLEREREREHNRGLRHDASAACALIPPGAADGGACPSTGISTGPSPSVQRRDGRDEGRRDRWTEVSRLQRPLEVLVLETTSWARKYAGVADVAVSWWLDRGKQKCCDGCSGGGSGASGGSGDCGGSGRVSSPRIEVPSLVVSGPAEVAAALWGLLAHVSQLAWYRLLFALAARYTYVNTLRPLGHGPASGAQRRGEIHEAT